MILKRNFGIPLLLRAYGEDCFKFTDNFIRIIPPISQHFTQTATQDGGNNGGLTVENIANKLGVSKRTIERDLSTPQKANIIRHSESRSKGFWELIQ